MSDGSSVLRATRGAAAVSAALAALSWSRPSLAWKYREHSQLGRHSYEHACETIRTSVLGALDADSKNRYHVACDLAHLYADQYGQFTALSGDHLDADNTQGILANVAAKNTVEYLMRAVDDGDHFHPQAPFEWRSYHKQALEKAVEAATNPHYIEQVEKFWTAFYLNAYADHFIQDSFSSGHSGFNRPASTPSASYGMHGKGNEEGKLFRDSAGREWISYGDTHLSDRNNWQGLLRVQKAADASVFDFLMAFVTGQRNRMLERDAALRLPILARRNCEPELALQQRIEERNARIDQAFWYAWADDWYGAPTGPDTAPPEGASDTGACSGEKWSSLLEMKERANYSFSHTIGGTDIGRSGHFEHVLAPTYSFLVYSGGLRFGFDFGWYFSTRSEGNSGVLVAPTLSIPLGGRYGTVLAWDIDTKFLALVPITSYESTAFVQHWAPAAGLAFSIQLGAVNFRASAGPALMVSNRIGVGRDRWSDHAGLGWFGQFGFHMVGAHGGGGRMQPPSL